jgi:hypothetical protein
MSSANPYAPPEEIENLPSRVSCLRVTVCYGGFGLIPAAVCAVLSPFVGEEGGAISLVTLPFALRLATWSCFRIRWRETPWFVGLFVAVPASCLLVTGVGSVVLLALPAIKLHAGIGFWGGRSCMAAAVAVAVDLAVANQLRQRSTFRETTIAGVVGALSIITVIVTSPVFQPLYTVLRVQPWMSPYAGPDPNTIAAAFMAGTVAVMINTGMGVLRRARRAMADEKSDQAESNRAEFR